MECVRFAVVREALVEKFMQVFLESPECRQCQELAWWNKLLLLYNILCTYNNNNVWTYPNFLNEIFRHNFNQYISPIMHDRPFRLTHPTSCVLWYVRWLSPSSHSSCVRIKMRHVDPDSAIRKSANLNASSVYTINVRTFTPVGRRTHLTRHPAYTFKRHTQTHSPSSGGVCV